MEKRHLRERMLFGSILYRLIKLYKYLVWRILSTFIRIRCKIFFMEFISMFSSMRKIIFLELNVNWKRYEVAINENYRCVGRI